MYISTSSHLNAVSSSTLVPPMTAPVRRSLGPSSVKKVRRCEELEEEGEEEEGVETNTTDCEDILFRKPHPLVS